MNYQTYRTLENLIFGLLLAAFLYAGYDLYQAFSLGALAKWGGLLFAGFLGFGFILPDWSDLEEVKPLFEEIQDLLAARKQTVYARELEAARVKLFLERDQTKRARKLLEKVPPETIKKEMVETWEALKTATPEKKESLNQRFHELEQTHARLKENSGQEERFAEQKKNVIASLQHLRVRLESTDEKEPGSQGMTVEESFRDIHNIMDRLDQKNRPDRAAPSPEKPLRPPPAREEE